MAFFQDNKSDLMLETPAKSIPVKLEGDPQVLMYAVRCTPE